MSLNGIDRRIGRLEGVTSPPRGCGACGGSAGPAVFVLRAYDAAATPATCGNCGRLTRFTLAIGPARAGDDA